MTLQDWSTTTTDALQDAWNRIVSYLPDLLGALVVIIVGILVANLIKWLAVRILNGLNVQRGWEELPFARTLREANMNVNLPSVIGEFLKWVTIVLFLIPSASILGVPQVSDLLNGMIRYLPNIAAAVIILFLGGLFAEFMGNIVRATALGLGSRTANSLAVFSQYMIGIFVGLAALSQLGIAESIIGILLTGFVAALAIASGLAFGLGGKDAAADLVAKIRRDFGNVSK